VKPKLLVRCAQDLSAERALISPPFFPLLFCFLRALGPALGEKRALQTKMARGRRAVPPKSLWHGLAGVFCSSMFFSFLGDKTKIKNKNKSLWHGLAGVFCYYFHFLAGVLKSQRARAGGCIKIMA
jgi:hypothetical protein